MPDTNENRSPAGLPEVETFLAGRLHPASFSQRRDPQARATATLLPSRTPQERRNFVLSRYATRKSDEALKSELSAVALAGRDLAAERTGGTDLARRDGTTHEDNYQEVVTRSGSERFPLTRDAARYAPPPPQYKCWPYC